VALGDRAAALGDRAVGQRASGGLAALPAAPSAVPACFVVSETRLADALAGLAASVEELRSVLREHS
jgi:hypothetical protein